MSEAQASIAEWFVLDPEPTLVGAHCEECGAVSFPPMNAFCPDPTCSSRVMRMRPLSRTGVLWSFTDMRFEPPAPYPQSTSEYRPLKVAAVELPERLVILGLLAEDVELVGLRVGMPMRLEAAVDLTHGSDGVALWRWRPLADEKAV